MKNGLCSNSCYDIKQDKLGYIWVATQNGLSRYNGKQWLKFQMQQPVQKYRLASNWVFNVTTTNNGFVWINTDKGVAYYNNETDSILKFSAPVKGWGRLQTINDSTLFISSWTGIEQYHVKNQQVLQSIKYYPETASNSIPYLFKDTTGNIWACPEDKPSLICINPTTKKCNYITNIRFQNKLIPIIINSITSYSTDTLLLSTSKYGLLKYNYKNNCAISYLTKLLPLNTDVNCCALYILNNVQYLVIGTKNKGLFIINISKPTQIYNCYYEFNNPSSIISNEITSLCVDNNEGIWIGTLKGLSYFHPTLQKSKHYFFYNNTVLPPSLQINVVTKLNDNEFLIGTENNGLFCYHESTKKTDEINFSQKNVTRITSITKFNFKQYLISTQHGVYVYQCGNKLCVPFKVANKLMQEYCLQTKLLNDSLLAFCTMKGFMLYNFKNQYILFSEIKSQAPENDKLICKDVFVKDNCIWILRFFNGFRVMDLKTKIITDYTPLEIKNKPIDYHNISASTNQIYISTTAGIIQQSLSHLNQVKLIKTAHGLMGDMIENVLCVNDSVLYYTTPEGIYQYNASKAKSNLISDYENYPQKWFNQLNFLDSQLVVSTISNYFMVHAPNHPFQNKQNTELHIERLTINSRSYPTKQTKFNLSHKENNISIQLAGLSYPNSEKNYWYYHLNTSDTITKTSTDGLIQLENLLPNEYTLTIGSVNNEGVISSKKLLIQFNIAQPFYNRWWFYSSLFLLMTALFASFYYYKRKQLLKLNTIRNQISRDLHDELGANVSSINIMAKMLLNKYQNENDLALVNISKYSIQISDTINDIIWNVNPKFDSVTELIKRMTRYASETLDASQIAYHIEQPTPYNNVVLDNQLKYNLYLIFKEAINNAAKYSQANLINIRISIESQSFSFQIIDDGNGFILENNESGNGLNNMQNRAEDIGAEFTITSHLQKGTTIYLIKKIS